MTKEIDGESELRAEIDHLNNELRLAHGAWQEMKQRWMNSATEVNMLRRDNNELCEEIYRLKDAVKAICSDSRTH